MDPHNFRRRHPPPPSPPPSADPFQSLNQHLTALSLSSTTAPPLNTSTNNNSWILSSPTSPAAAAATSDFLQQQLSYYNPNDVVLSDDQFLRNFNAYNNYNNNYVGVVGNREENFNNFHELMTRNNVGGYSYPGYNPITDTVPSSASAAMLGLLAQDYYGDAAAAAAASLMMRRRAATADVVNSSVSDEHLAMLYQLHNNETRLSAFRTRLENDHARAGRVRNYGVNVNGNGVKYENGGGRRRANSSNHEYRMRGHMNMNRNHHDDDNNHIVNYNHNNNHNSNNYMVGLEVDWKELKGKVVSFVKDPQKYRVLQHMLEEASREDIKMIVGEVKDDLASVVVTQSGGQFFQRLLEFCDDHDVTDLLRAVMVHEQFFVDICLDNHGSRAMQRLIKKIDGGNAEQKSILLPVMRRVIRTLLTNANSYHFVTEMFSSLKDPKAYDLITPLFDDIADHLLEIGVDKFGCCALHICLEHGHKGAQRDRVLQKIVSHALELSQNHYGNYVVQYVISKPEERFSSDIIRSLYGKFAYFCMNKYASHVVEKCISSGTVEHVEQIINEIMEDVNFRKILLNETGNYVVQKAITRCTEVTGDPEADNTLLSLFNKLTDSVIAMYPFLHYDPLGKHVWNHAKTEKEKNRRRMFRSR